LTRLRIAIVIAGTAGLQGHGDMTEIGASKQQPIKPAAKPARDIGRRTATEGDGRFRDIFEGARVALWDEDFSQVLALLDELRVAGITDMRAYFAQHPERLREAVEGVRLLDVNRYALELFEADRKAELLTSLTQVFLPASRSVFVDQLVTLADGKRQFESEIRLQTLKGREFDAMLSIAFDGPRCERTLASVVDISAVKTAQRALKEQKRRFQSLNRAAKTISSDLDFDRIVQTVTDIATELAGARFGAFFYNKVDEQGEAYMLYALSGAPPEAFAKFGLPRNTAVFEPTFRGAGVVRSDDIRKDPRYGKSAPHHGMPAGHLPVVSYLAVPVVSKSGVVHGGLFFGHDQPGMFTRETEDAVVGIAAHAAVAVDNARLLQSAHVEIAQRRKAEFSARHYASIIENSGDAIASTNLDGIIQSWNPGAERLFGYTAEEAVGQPITIVIPPDRASEERVILQRIRRGERIEHQETVRQRKDGSQIDVSLTVSPVKDSEGGIVGASKIARDITERRRAQEQQQLLVGEIKHRIKNTLATVQAIARQTLQNAPEADFDAFIARLGALASAQDLLTIERWNRAALHELVDQALRPFQQRHSARIHTTGSADIYLDAQKASLLTMALHELATNAVKYGCLSNATGSVQLTWRQSGDDQPARIRITWAESGGPPVAPPERKGFGSFLIERALGGSDGQAQLIFDRDGLRCELEIAL
jgi:PAS domain S-box-containing protein